MFAPMGRRGGIRQRQLSSVAVGVTGLTLAALIMLFVGTASGERAPRINTKNYMSVLGEAKSGHTGDTLREEVDCPKGWFAMTGGYVTSGIVVSTVENLPVHHPEGWVTIIYAPPAPLPLPPMDDVTLKVKVDCARGGIPVVLPVGSEAQAPGKTKPKPKDFMSVFSPVKEGKSGDKLAKEVDCPKGWFAINGGYVASGIIVSTWSDYPVRHPDGWVAVVYAPPNGPFGPAQDVSLLVRVDCARSGVQLVYPVENAVPAQAGKPKPKPKRFVTVYGTQQVGKSGDALKETVRCPEGWFAVNGGYQTSGNIASTWQNFPARHRDGWKTEIYAPPAGPYAPPQDVTLDVKVDCAKPSIPVVFPTS
jgi:hypothetical protein